MKKLAYIKLNRQMPCPPRGTVPVDQGCGYAGIFQPNASSSLSVMAATIPAMSEQRKFFRQTQQPKQPKE